MSGRACYFCIGFSSLSALERVALNGNKPALAHLLGAFVYENVVVRSNVYVGYKGNDWPYLTHTCAATNIFQVENILNISLQS